MCGSKSRTFVSASIILLRMIQHRKREVRRTLPSLPVAYPLPQNQERECAVLRTTHSLSVVYYLPQNRTFSASRVPSPPVSCKKYKYSVV